MVCYLRSAIKLIFILTLKMVNLVNTLKYNCYSYGYLASPDTIFEHLATFGSSCPFSFSFHLSQSVHSLYLNRLILSKNSFAVSLLPSKVCKDTMRNSRKHFMSFSSFITRLMSLLSVVNVMHSQQQKGKSFSYYGLIELMCFLNNQNRDEKPPYTKERMLDTLHEAFEISLVKVTSSLSQLNFLLSPVRLIYSYTRISFLSFIGNF